MDGGVSELIDKEADDRGDSVVMAAYRRHWEYVPPAETVALTILWIVAKTTDVIKKAATWNIDFMWTLTVLKNCY